MATTISAMDLVAVRRRMGYSAQEIDSAAVERIVAEAEGASREQITKYVMRIHSMIQRGERMKDRECGVFVSLETMAATADALTAKLAGE